LGCGAGRVVSEPSLITKTDPFKGFQSSPEVIRPAVMIYVRFPLSLRNVEDLLHERGIEISHETVCGALSITKAKCWKAR
jgi:transposase-like protein